MTSERPEESLKQNGTPDVSIAVKRSPRASPNAVRICQSTMFAESLSKLIHGRGFVYAAQFVKKLRIYIRRHPYLFALQLAGLLVGTAAISVLPILGALGFSTVGPVAGSVAAGWQAAIGLVRAGSLFAFSQSAAMGGAAAGGIVAAGVGGFGVAALASIAKLRVVKEGLKRFFRRRNSE